MATKKKPGNGKDAAATETASPAAAPRKRATAKKAEAGTTASQVEVTCCCSAAAIDKAAIAHRAWEIWQREGCPEGRAVEHWLQAERELQSS